MKREWIGIWTVLLLLLANSCQSASTPTMVPTASPPPSDTQASRQQAGVVLVALDGARPDWLAGYMQDGTMPNLAALAKRGVTAAYMQTVDPALAAPAYFSLSTGAFPNSTGLVSAKYHVPGAAFPEPVGELDKLIASPETVWRTAMRNGLKTATLFWPSAALDVPNLQANYMVAVAESDVPAVQHVISFQEANGWEAAPISFSPLQEGVLRIASQEDGTVATFNVLAAGGLDDDAPNYDRLILDSDKNLANGHTELQPGKWAAVTVSPRLHSGAYFCFTASDGVTATVYQSRVSYNRARPIELLRSVNELGFPPPTPDIEALRLGWLSPQQYYEMAELRAKWMMDVVSQVYRAYQPALLLTAQNIIAECARPFLVVDERQQGYSLETAELYAAYRQKAHSVADANLGRLLSLVNVADSAMLVISGHGLSSVHTSVRLNAILKDAKLLYLDTSHEQDTVDEDESKALAFASGGSAHIYINLLGRDQPGLVAPEEYEDIQQQIVEMLEETQDEDGQPVFARILTRDELSRIHLDSPNSGDLFVQAAPGYWLSDALGFEEFLVPSPYGAEGGLDATLPEMHGIFIAAGNDLVSGKPIPPVHITDIAPTIARVLGFSSPATVSGQAIEDIWR